MAACARCGTTIDEFDIRCPRCGAPAGSPAAPADPPSAAAGPGDPGAARARKGPARHPPVAVYAAALVWIAGSSVVLLTSAVVFVGWASQGGSQFVSQVIMPHGLLLVGAGIVLPLAFLVVGIQVLRHRTMSLQGPAWFSIVAGALIVLLAVVFRGKHVDIGDVLASAQVLPAYVSIAAGSLGLAGSGPYMRYLAQRTEE